MTTTNWHSPLRCPRCDADSGHPVSVRSNSSHEVVVNVKCDICAHEWKLERQTPTFAPLRDRREFDDAPE